MPNSNHLSFRDAPKGAGPESITTIVSMDSLMCNCTSKLARSLSSGRGWRGPGGAPRNDKFG